MRDVDNGARNRTRICFVLLFAVFLALGIEQSPILAQSSLSGGDSRPSGDAPSPGARLPPLELERRRLELKTPINGRSVRVDADLEGSSPCDVAVISRTHVVISLTTPSPRTWFMFRLRGVRGLTVRVDVKGPSEDVREFWGTLNPMFSYESDLQKASTFAYSNERLALDPEATWNGVRVPTTSGQKWHYISNTWCEGPHSFSMVQLFEADEVVISMRIPYTPRYNESYLRAIASRNSLRIVEVGRSARNRPLLLAEIGEKEAGGAAASKKPCVVVYAGEHADEPDAMWVAHGLIEYLASDRPEVAEIRRRMTFIVIPMLDPDASGGGVHDGVGTTFLQERKTKESIAYANWFHDWISAGKRLDLVLDLHNVQSQEIGDVACALMPGLEPRGAMAEALHSQIISRMESSNFNVSHKAWMRGWSPDRLGGWLSRRYGAMCMAYEVNSQARARHLPTSSMCEMGKLFAIATGQFLISKNGIALLTDVELRRQERMARLRSHAVQEHADAIELEAMVSKGIGIRTHDNPGVAVENWVD